MDMLHTTEVMAIFVIFWPIVAKNWLPWQYPLVPCHQECLVWIGRPRKPPVISNHILVISRLCKIFACYLFDCMHYAFNSKHVANSAVYEPFSIAC